VKRTLKAYLAQVDGSTTAEFVLVLPVLIFFVFSIINICFLVYATSSLHWAAEQSARCGAMSQINTGLACGSIANTATFAQSAYKGPGLSSLTFTSADDTTNNCRRVSGSGTYQIRAIFLDIDVPLSSTACFPADTTTAWPAT
jgi:Flp pilus assembly protein TadG